VWDSRRYLHSRGWEIHVDYDFNNAGDSSNFIKASYTVTRGGSLIDSWEFLNRNTSWPCGVASDSGNSCNAGDKGGGRARRTRFAGGVALGTQSKR